MGAFRELVDLLATCDPNVSMPDPGEGIEEVRARAAAHSEVLRLIDLVAREKRCFSFGVLAIHPRVFTRLERHPGVLGPHEIVLGHDGGGDLYLFDAETSGVRRVIHDENWATRGHYPSLDAFMERIAWVSVESIEPEEVEELLAEPSARHGLRWALSLAVDALQDETREALCAAGVPVDAESADS